MTTGIGAANGRRDVDRGRGGQPAEAEQLQPGRHWRARRAERESQYALSAIKAVPQVFLGQRPGSGAEDALQHPKPIDPCT